MNIINKFKEISFGYLYDYFSEEIGRRNIEILSVIVLSSILRFFKIGQESFNLDEAFTMNFVTSKYTTTELIFKLPLTDPHPPLYYTTMDFWLALFSNTEIIARMPSVVFGVLAVASTYLLGKKLLDHYTGIFASLLMGISSFQIYYSQRVRMYSLLVFLTSLSCYYMLNILQDKESIRNNLKYVLTTFLLAYTHVFGLFVILGQNSYIFSIKILEILRNQQESSDIEYKNSDIIQWLKPQAVIGLLISPYLFLLFYRILGYGEGLTEISWIETPNIPQVLDALTSFLIWDKLQIPDFGIIGLRNSIEAFYLIIMFLALLSIFIKYRNNRISFQTCEKRLLPGFILLTPLLGAYVISYLIRPIFAIRFTIPASIGAYILLGNFLKNIYTIKPANKLKSVISLLLVSLVLLISILQLPVLYGETQNAQWRELENDLSKVSENGDLVVLSASYMEIPLVFYDSNSRLNITSTLDENAAKNILENRSRAWLILSETRRELFLETISSNNLDISKRGEYKDDIFKNEESRGIYLYRVENIKSQ